MLFFGTCGTVKKAEFARDNCMPDSRARLKQTESAAQSKCSKGKLSPQQLQHPPAYKHCPFSVASNSADQTHPSTAFPSPHPSPASEYNINNAKLHGNRTEQWLHRNACRSAWATEKLQVQIEFYHLKTRTAIEFFSTL